MAQGYVEATTAGSWRVAGSRISLDSIVHAYWERQSPEAMADDFPTLSLEQIHGAIAFYLGNREKIDPYLDRQAEAWEQLRRESEKKLGPLLQRVRAGSSRSH